MASHTVTAGMVGEHEIVLTPNTIETVTFAQFFQANIEVISDGAAAVYYTLDGTDPTIAGDQCYLLPKGSPAVDSRRPSYTTAATVVKLISVGSPTVSVQRGN